ncbi:hypothetical protein SDC9_141912 [bioreactor metagenome]|uniref:Uncharacterized protein n=1 Tax=bioreactor metagenome TaxID=1076179 RepID=A0A645DZ16_9ZZZZ
MAGGFSDVFNVPGADALLTGAHADAGRLLLAGEPGLHRGHTGVNQQQGRIVLRDEGKAGQAEMTLALEEGKEHLPQFVETVFFHA